MPRFVKLARMARHVTPGRKDHGPGQARVGGAAPQLAIDEVRQPHQENPDRRNAAGDVAERQDRDAVLPGEPHHRHDASEEAAMEGHAAFPQFEDGSRMFDEEGQVVKQDITGAATENDAERHPQDEIVDLRQTDRRGAGP
ncbi:hypothetical protein ACVWWR_001893 [Bradyrhizobium sp. LM3.2]